MADDPASAMDSVDPPPPPPPPKDKRKWNPSTWRYRIEESQAELGSKPRRESNVLPSSYSPATQRDRQRERDREREKERERMAASGTQKRLASPEKDQIGSRRSPARHFSERAGIRKKQSQKDVGEAEDGGKWNAVEETAEKVKKRKLKEEEEEEEEEEEDEENGMRKWMEKEQGMGRRKRELTPSELYFCEVCSGRAA